MDADGGGAYGERGGVVSGAEAEISMDAPTSPDHSSVEPNQLRNDAIYNHYFEVARNWTSKGRRKPTGPKKAQAMVLWPDARTEPGDPRSVQPIGELGELSHLLDLDQSHSVREDSARK